MQTNDMLNLILTILDDNSGFDITTLDIRKQSSIADYVVLASANSGRHAITLADKVIYALKQAGIKNITAEGSDLGNWIAIDLSSIVVHIFKSEVREYYALEEIWK